ncbi:MAG: dihydropteroate synthase, partial [Verrucomicrobiota bacterium]
PFYELAAAHEAGVIICYVAGDHVREVETLVMVEDHVGRLVDAFAQEVENAVQAGVKALWLDPGLGFYYKNLQDSAERVQYQMNAFLQGFRIRELGWPTCQALPHAFEFFEDEVRCAEPFFAVMAGLGKTDLIRTHEVSRVHGVLRTMECFDGGEG